MTFAAHFAKMWWAYLVIFVMICLSAYFSASEIAFNSANKMRLRRAAEGGSKTAKIAYDITEKFTTALSAILIGNNLANIAVSTCTTLIVMNLFKDNVGLASTIATILVTVVILIFGEILPKVLAKQNADTVVRFIAIPTRILTIILSPFVFIVMMILLVLRKIWGKDHKDDDPTVTEEELVTIIDTIEEEGLINEEQGELLQSTLDFRDSTVEKIMTPRIDMTAMDIDSDEEKIAAMLSENAQYSRLPVYDESIDNIIGILSLTRYYKATLGEEKPDIRALLMKPCRIHKTMKLPAALTKLRDAKMHMAVVIDEFGGTLGVVTMEDILEELVGDIWDEHDEVVEDYKEISENTFRIDCGGNLSDFIEFFDLEIESDSITINGWIMEVLDKIPACGDRFSFENLDITVTETDYHRVSLIHVVRNEITDEDEDDDKRSKKERDEDEDDTDRHDRHDRHDRDEDDDDSDRDTRKKTKERSSV